MDTPQSTPEPDPGDSPLTQVLVSMSGASHGDHGTSPPGADQLSVTAGHEPDRFSAAGILLVPIAVGVTLVVTYILVTVLFGVLNRGKAPTPSTASSADQGVVKENQAPINNRFATISSTDPKPIADAGNKQIAPAVAQPRLEYLRQQGDTQDPPYMRSKRPLSEGNSPEYKPEDLRPENFVDPTFKARVLAEYGYIGDKKESARVPVNDYIRYEIGQKKLPVRKDAPRLPVTCDEQAKLSNSGRGGLVPAGTKSAEPRDDHKDHDHDPAKKNDKDPKEPAGPIKKENGNAKNSKNSSQ